MKIRFFIFFLIIFNSCSNEKKVFWCGDHACINNSERKLYFKKTMTVEIKKFNYQKDEDDNDAVSKILSKEKSLTKKKLKDEKDKIKAEKRLAKQKLKEEKDKIKEEKRLAKEELDSEKKIKKNTPTNSTVVEINDYNEDFGILREKVTNRNMFRPFPNINDIPN